MCTNASNEILEPSETEIPTAVPSMDEFKDEINQSFHRISEGDILKGQVIGVSDTEVTVDLGSYAEGIIPLEELSNNPAFSIHADIQKGETITGIVIKPDNGDGNILLSLKKAADILAWDTLKEALNSRRIYSVKITQAVNGGVITFLEGIRAFMPASQLSLSYVENLETWVGKTVDAIVITVDTDKSRLVLSAKEVERDRSMADRSSKISRLQIGLVTTGKIEKIAPYGVFVNIGDGLSGLVHISQICGKRIESPREIVKDGQEVKVKIIDVKDGKISLSMKAVEDRDNTMDRVNRAPIEFKSDESASTSLGSLLSQYKVK